MSSFLFSTTFFTFNFLISLYCFFDFNALVVHSLFITRCYYIDIPTNNPNTFSFFNSFAHRPPTDELLFFSATFFTFKFLIFLYCFFDFNALVVHSLFTTRCYYIFIPTNNPNTFSFFNSFAHRPPTDELLFIY